MLLSTVYQANMDINPGWTARGQWAWGDPTGQGGAAYGNPDPNNGATGTNVYGVNLSGDYSVAAGGPYYLTTGAINCTGATNVQLQFQRWLNTDYSPYATATVDVSNNGTTWTNLYTNSTSSHVVDNAWSLQSYNISTVADNQAAVYIRWGYQVTSGAYAYSGWNIDDVLITGTLASNGITIPSVGQATPYPSTFVVSGVTGNITDVNVKLLGFSHTYASDIDILLVGPGGQKAILMSDAGGNASLMNVNLVLDDDAAADLPQSAIASGSYKPTDYQTGDSFASPAPAGPYTPSLTMFDGTSPNGVWSLYVMDDASGDSGSITSWELEITTTTSAGQISGIKWNDLDGDGVRDGGEPGLPNWQIYLDANSNGAFDLGETSVFTSADGSYTFTNLSPGTYVVGEVIPSGWQQTYPGASGMAASASGWVSLAPTPITTTGGNDLYYIQGERVGPDMPIGGGVQPLTNTSGPLINIDDFRADPRFSSINGSGYATVIIDTGIDLNHPFFGPDANSDGIADRIVYQYDFSGSNDSDATDTNGHGSNVSSIVASSDATYKGMAPGANIIHLKVFPDGSGSASSVDIEEALQWVAANAATYNILSVNMSLGSGNYSTATASVYSDEILAVTNAGVLVVCAAGNSFYSFSSAQGVALPAADANAIAVSAVWDSNSGGPINWSSGAIDYTTGADRLTSFTQRSGTLTDIMAPGAFISGANHTGGIVSYGGTSQASPHIAGIAVLAQQLAISRIGRKLTLAEFRALLASSGVTVVDGDDENDNVTNTNLSFKRVDVMALANAIYDMGGTAVPYHHTVTVSAGQTVANVNFGNKVDLDAPVVASEPAYTAGTTNTISWGSVTGATGYYMEWDTSSSFTTPDGNSGWIAATSFTATGLTHGVQYYYRVKAQNATSESAWSNIVSSTQDAVAPAAPSINSISSDTGVSSTDGITSDRTLILMGTAEAGATVQLFRDGNSIGSTTADGSSNWTFNYAGTSLADGQYIFTAKAVDAAGNQPDLSAERDVIVDTTGPTDITLSNSSVPENQSGAVVGTLSSTDVDVWDAFVYSLVAGTGDTGNSSFTIVGNELRTNAALDFEAQQTYSVRLRSTDLAGNFFDKVFTINVTNISEAAVAGRNIFYNRSYFDGNNAAANTTDDNAIATDKSALLPGQTATFANYTSYSRGINGIMIDLSSFTGTLSASDFTFRVGNNNTPGGWATAPAPSSITQRTLGNGNTRVTLIWADNAIQKQWLQVTLLASANTDLAADDVFYFGNAIGEGVDSATNALVNPTDEYLTRINPRTLLNRAPVTFPYDYDRDGLVNPSDGYIARTNPATLLTAIKLITVPGSVGGSSAMAVPVASNSDGNDAIFSQTPLTSTGGDELLSLLSVTEGSVWA